MLREMVDRKDEEAQVKKHAEEMFVTAMDDTRFPFARRITISRRAGPRGRSSGYSGAEEASFVNSELPCSRIRDALVIVFGNVSGATPRRFIPFPP